MTAPSFLLAGKRKDRKAKNRLTEIVVDEVSVVDRAANECKFVVIKREENGDMTETNANGNGSLPAMILTAAAKASFAESLMKILQPVLAVSEAVKEAPEKDDGAGILPADMVATLKSAHDGRAELYLAQLKKDAGDAVESFVQVAKLSIALAEDVALNGITDEVKARATQMSELLKTLTGGTAAPAPAVQPPAPAPAAAPAAAPASVPVETQKGVVDAQIAALVTTVTTLAGKVDTLTEIVAKGGAAPKTIDDSEVKKKLAELGESIKQTRAKVDKAMGAPPARGSFEVVPAPKPAEAERRIFPHVYGSQTHDPAPAKA